MKKLAHLFVFSMMLPGLVFGQTIDQNPDSLDAQFAQPTNLTDQQMDEAKNFVHQGQKDRIIKEKCAAANDCQDKGEGFPIETLIGKAYTIIGMFSGGNGLLPEMKVKSKGSDLKDTKPAEGAKPEGGEAPKPEGGQTAEAPAADQAGGDKAAAGEKGKGEEKQKDYCMMIAMAYEGISMVMQDSLQKKAQNTQVPGDEQLQALVSLQETHKARMKTAKYQSYVYGGVTACYTSMLIWGGAVADPSFILKMGGAAALTGLYIQKANKHKNAAEKVGDVIAAMDWAGKDCNPWTKSACFCSEPTSKDLYPAQYQEVCVLNNGNFATPKVAVGCVAPGENNTMAFDQECKCKATNSCVKSSLQLYNPKFGLGNNVMGATNKTFDLLNNGDLDTAQLDRATLQQTATASKIKFPNATKIKSPPLTADQKAAAQELANYMPPQAAAAMASVQPTNRNGIMNSDIGSSAISKLSENVKEKLSEAINAGYRTKGGGNSPFKSSRGDDDFILPKFGAQETKNKDNEEVLTFAEKAISKADVSNSPSTPIFDIISNRYRRSGWAKLDTEGK